MGKRDKANAKIAEEVRALSTIVQDADSFEIEDMDGKKIKLKLHPLQLGRLAMISKRLIDLDLVFNDDEDKDVVKQMWQICADKAKCVAEIIAIATLRTKQEIDDSLEERTELLLNSPTMTPTAFTNVLSAIVFQSYYADFMSAIRSVKTLRVRISPKTTAE